MTRKVVATNFIAFAASLMFDPTAAVAARVFPQNCVDSHNTMRSRSLLRQAEEAIAAHKYRQANHLLDRFEATFHDPLPGLSPRNLIDDSPTIMTVGKIEAERGDFRAAALDKHQALASRLQLYDWKCGRVRNGRLPAGTIK